MAPPVPSTRPGVVPKVPACSARAALRAPASPPTGPCVSPRPRTPRGAPPEPLPRPPSRGAEGPSWPPRPPLPAGGAAPGPGHLKPDIRWARSPAPSRRPRRHGRAVRGIARLPACTLSSPACTPRSLLAPQDLCLHAGVPSLCPAVPCRHSEVPCLHPKIPACTPQSSACTLRSLRAPRDPCVHPKVPCLHPEIPAYTLRSLLTPQDLRLRADVPCLRPTVPCLRSEVPRLPPTVPCLHPDISTCTPRSLPAAEPEQPRGSRWRQVPVPGRGRLRWGLAAAGTTMEFSELIKTATVESVLLSCPGLPAVKGTLCITSHHLLLSSCPGGDAQPSTVELWLLIRNVDAVEKRVQNLGWYQPPRTNGSLRDTRLAGSSGTITLRCKDLKVLQLEIPGMEECLNIASSIEALSSVDSVMMMYPFFYRPESLKLEEGWHLFPLEQYFQQIASQTSQWRLSDVNWDFTTCPTYPPAVIVPAAVDDDTLRKAARFRQGGRFPVLSYYHPKNGTAMLRSSQPLTGPNRKRCREDETLLGTVLDEGERGFIIDTRSAQAAKQARMTGGGTEPKSSYPQWRRLHRPLERGRPLQESFIKLVEACNDTSINMDRWLSRLESCRWLSHVKAALSTACLAAQCMDREEASVLVHGAEGTDTTLLVTALAQVILDPSCRTLAGFQGLLEREWIEAGHPFHLRCARSAYSHARLKQEAPLFLLFLDCVWQLSRQFPFSLEFSERLLLTLFDNAYASTYGTFLCNNEKERCLCKVKESTHSLWAWLNQPGEKKKYLNPLYSHNALVIWPSVEPQSIQLWQGLFFRWIRASQYLDEAWAEIQRLVEGSDPPIKESAGNRLSRSLSDPTAWTENER